MSEAPLGGRPRTLTPVRPLPGELPGADRVTRPAIDRALDVLLEALCRQLANANQGVREVTLRAFRVDHDVRELHLGTRLPTGVPDHLRRLFANIFEAAGT
jgi:protein ImuB